MAFVLVPELPLGDWIADLDNQVQRSERFFVGRPVVLDVSRMTLTRSDLSELIADLRARDIRVMGIEGADPSWLGPGSPPLLKGGRPAGGIIEKLDAPAENLAIPMSGEQQPSSQVRSGQSVIFPSGDVTVIGSVASGAEVVAGDSIHIYGTLRGRAMAGSTGNARARIFCRKVEAELLAIGDRRSLQDRRDIDASLRSRPVQAWLEADDGIL